MKFLVYRTRNRAYQKVEPAFRVRTLYQGKALPAQEEREKSGWHSALFWAGGLVMLGGLFLVASFPETSSSPEGPLLIAALVTFGISLPFIASFVVPKVRGWCKDVKLPLILERSVIPAIHAISSIVKKAKDPIVRSDPQALALAREACVLYDNFLLELREIHASDPGNFERTYQDMLNGYNYNSAHVLWIRDCFLSVETLLGIDAKLGEIITFKTQQHVRDAQQKALEDPKRDEFSSSLIDVKEAFAELVLREEIKKESSSELEMYLKELERS